MVLRRALIGLLCWALGSGAAQGSGVALGAAKAASKKHPAAKATIASKTRPTIRRAPEAKPAKAKKKRRGKVVTKLAFSKATRTRTPAVKAVAERPEGGRDAVIERLSLSLANPRMGIENASTLRPFLDQLHQLELDPKSQMVRILQFGDSHTAADMFTGAMRTLFQNKFGDGGAGFSYAGYPFAGYRIHGTRRAQSTGWLALGTHLRDIGDGMVGMGGVSLSTDRSGNWVSLDADATWLEVHYLTQPGGGPIAIYDGEKLLTTVSTDGPVTAGHYGTAVEPGDHHFEVRTTDYAPVRLLGLVTEKASGATYEALGLNGAEASLILRWNEAIQQVYMDQREPSLIVLSYGTNEASDHNWTQEGYAAMFRSLIARCHRLAPNASILVIGPPDRALRAGRRGWTPFAGVDRIVQAQRSVCRQMGCAYWDQRGRMGGLGSMRQWVSVQWAQADHTHFTGTGYTELAGALFSDIVQQYNRYEGESDVAKSVARGESR